MNELDVFQRFVAPQAAEVRVVFDRQALLAEIASAQEQEQFGRETTLDARIRIGKAFLKALAQWPMVPNPNNRLPMHSPEFRQFVRDAGYPDRPNGKVGRSAQRCLQAARDPEAGKRIVERGRANAEKTGAKKILIEDVLAFLEDFGPVVLKIELQKLLDKANVKANAKANATGKA